jgi:hypothetical protein
MNRGVTHRKDGKVALVTGGYRKMFARQTFAVKRPSWVIHMA